MLKYKLHFIPRLLFQPKLYPLQYLVIYFDEAQF
jgi:hypothetical protein